VEKIAVPVSNKRVSPVFDVAQRLLVVGTDSGTEVEQAVYDLVVPSAYGRARLLSELGVGTLICGGISREMAWMIERQGVHLIPWVAADVEDVLSAYLAGRLPAPQFMMPGCREHGHRQRREPGGGAQRSRQAWRLRRRIER